MPIIMTVASTQTDKKATRIVFLPFLCFNTHQPIESFGVACSHVVFILLKGLVEETESSCSLDVTGATFFCLGYCYLLLLCDSTGQKKTHKTHRHKTLFLLVERDLFPRVSWVGESEEEVFVRAKENETKCDSIFFRVLLLYYYQSNQWSIEMSIGA
jgi:hypothetical protein